MVPGCAGSFWGATTAETLAAADAVAEDGVSAEVIDVATLRPLDMATILDSVERTGRCVIAHEAVLSGGFGGEIAARIADAGLMHLLAPVKRVAAYDTIVPLPRLEKYFFPDRDRLMSAVQSIMDYQ